MSVLENKDYQGQLKHCAYKGQPDFHTRILNAFQGNASGLCTDTKHTRLDKLFGVCYTVFSGEAAHPVRVSTTVVSSSTLKTYAYYLLEGRPYRHENQERFSRL